MASSWPNQEFFSAQAQLRNEEVKHQFPSMTVNDESNRLCTLPAIQMIKKGGIIVEQSSDEQDEFDIVEIVKQEPVISP